MCGILALVYEGSDEGTAKKLIAVLEPYLKRRGSDACGSVVSRSTGVVVEGRGCVLNMRGCLTEQPLRDAVTGDWLLWNGEVFGGRVEVSDCGNDTEVMLRVLSTSEDEDSFLRTMSSVQGPWAMIYWKASTRSLWFGRDVLGRRSLLWHHPTVHDDNMFALSSVACCHEETPVEYWSEVPAGGLYRLQFNNDCLSSSSLLCHPWADKNGLLFRTQLQTELASVQSCWNLSISHLTIQAPFDFLNRALPPLSLTASTNDHVEKDTAMLSGGQWRQDAHKLMCFLEEAIRKRVVSAPVIVQPSSCSVASSQEPMEEDTQPRHSAVPPASADHMKQGTSRVAILYSGGLDSAVMAALVDRCLPVSEEVDLINVAFVKTPSDDKAVPDRLTAIGSLKELNPRRHWNLVLVNVLVEELNQLRQEHISHLVYPLNTVLDDSLGCAMWFAARGKGVLYTASKPLQPEILYQSRARVVLVGIGADEQMAGYTRHRTCFTSRGWSGVLDEIETDIKRLSSRNLGRDDRCIGDHHREARFPFLDEEVVNYLHKLPIWRKADLTLPRGEGDKRLLREVAAVLGCGLAARLPKKAMQFGSHMAKIAGSAGGKEHGHNKCSRLKHN